MADAARPDVDRERRLCRLERRPTHMYYDDSRTYFRREEDFPGPKTMAAAAEWIRTAASRHDRFFLFVDEFDPHEPFDTPEPYREPLRPRLGGTTPDLAPLSRRCRSQRPGYATSAPASRPTSSKLTMINRWLPVTFLDAIDEAGLRNSTAVILCTDHGHYLGEHDLFGKPAAPVYSELGRIPLMIRWPGAAPRDVDAAHDLSGPARHHR